MSKILLYRRIGAQERKESKANGICVINLPQLPTVFVLNICATCDLGGSQKAVACFAALAFIETECKAVTKYAGQQILDFQSIISLESVSKSLCTMA
jgi:hypothetical protein